MHGTDGSLSRTKYKQLVVYLKGILLAESNITMTLEPTLCIIRQTLNPVIL